MALMALRIIDEQGLTSLSTASLAEALGLSSGAPFKHFASWEDIYREMVHVGLERIDQTFPDADLGGMDRLFGLMRNRIEAIQSIPGLTWLLRSEQAYLTLPADSVVALQEMSKRSKTFLLDAIKQGMDVGEIRNDIPPQEMLVIVMGTIHALSGMPRVRNPNKKESPDRVLQALRTLLASETPAAKSTKRNDDIHSEGARL